MDKSESTETESTITYCSVLEQVTQRKLTLRSVHKNEYNSLRSNDVQVAKARKIWKAVENHKSGHCELPQKHLEKLKNKLSKIIRRTESLPVRVLRRCRSEIQYLNKVLTKSSSQRSPKHYWPCPTDVTLETTAQVGLSENLFNDSIDVTCHEEKVKIPTCKSPSFLPPLSEVLEYNHSQLDPYQNHLPASNSNSKRADVQIDWQMKNKLKSNQTNQTSMNEELVSEAVIDKTNNWEVSYKDLSSFEKTDAIYKKSTPPMFESQNNAGVTSLRKDSGNVSCEAYSNLGEFLDTYDERKNGRKDVAKMWTAIQSNEKKAPNASVAGFSATFQKNLNKPTKTSYTGSNQEQSFGENVLFGNVKDPIKSTRLRNGLENQRQPFEENMCFGAVKGPLESTRSHVTHSSENYFTYDVVNDFKLKNDLHNARFHNSGVKESNPYDSNELFLKEMYDVCRSQSRQENLDTSLNWEIPKAQEELIYSTYSKDMTPINMSILERSVDLNEYQVLDSVKYILTDSHVSEIASTINVNKTFLQSVIENVLIDENGYKKNDDMTSVICPSPILDYHSKRRYSQKRF